MYSFSKQERLTGEIRITKLYTEGKAFIVYPIRVVYCIEKEKADTPVKVLMSVPKKRFKRANKRNRLKRLMRESYRLNKSILLDLVAEKEINIQIAFNYVANEEFEFQNIEEKMKIALQKIANKI